MPEQIKDPVAVYFQAGALLLSIATCLVLLAIRSQRTLLAFRPRRPVPWNAVGALLACVFVFLIVSSAVRSSFEPREADREDTRLGAVPPAYRLIDQIVAPTMIVGVTLLTIMIFFRPTQCDFGLPADGRELAEDVALGLIVGLAALAPVLITQALLMSWLEIESGHELVKILRAGEPNAFVFALGAVAAVVVAPVCEEIVFRLLLQGWLEKLEAKQIIFVSNRESRLANDELPETVVPLSAVCDFTMAFPPARGVGGWPFGWVPIATSSALFALAHYGYGPDPVPLFLFALFLGYVYQRTHRIVPCMIAHAVFNAFSVFMLWRIVFYGAN